jgi:hypothetical protein
VIAGTGGRWVPLDVPSDLETSYRAATGWSAADPPLGLSTVVARRAWASGADLPPGGVLVEMALRHLDTPPGDGRWQTRVDVTEIGVRAGRRRIRVTTGLRDAGDRDVADIDFVLDWPA